MTKKEQLQRVVSPARSRSGNRSDEGPSDRAADKALRKEMRRDSKRMKRAERQASRTKSTKSPTHKGDLPDNSVDDATFLAEWKITKQQEEQKLNEFLQLLKNVGALRTDFDRYTYRRFLRARQHDLARAKEMWVAHLAWRKELGADTILDSFEFNERDAFISIYPQGYHKTDKQGRPIYIQHIGQINLKRMWELTTEERMIKFHVQEYERCCKYIMPACSARAGRHIDQTFAILDLHGVGLRHITGEVKRVMQRTIQLDQDNYPEMLGHTCIINAGAVVSFIFRMIKPYLDLRTQNKIEVCPKDYQKVLLEWIDAENLPEYLGGTSKATLLDDAGPWNDPALIAQIDAEVKSGRPKLKLTQLDGLSAAKEDQHAAAAVRSDAATDSDAVSGASPPGHGETYFSEPESLSGARVPGRQLSVRSADDEAYYSPLSRDSGYWSASESVRSGAAEPDLGRDSIPHEPTDLILPPASSSAESSPRAGVGGAVKGGRGGLVQPVDARGTAEPALQIPILARVRALEDRVPGLQQRLADVLPLGARLSRRDLGDGTVMARVATLEEAVTALLQAQELVAEREAQRQQAEKKGGGCLPCCCIQ